MVETEQSFRNGPSRRTVLKGIGAGVAASAISAPWVARAAGTIKIGVVTPATGPLANFGATDGWTIDKIKKLLADGLETSAGKYNVEILVRDGQSDPNRAAEVAGDLILNEDVHIIMPTSTTDMVSNTMDQAELNQCPCISSGAPWQAVIFPRGGDKKPFDWTYHFFWGLGEALQHLRRPVEHHRDQPQGRHAVPAERRRRDVGQRHLRPAGAHQGGRFRGHRAGLLPAAHQRLHGADHGLQVGQLRYRRRHHLSGRHQDLRQPVRPAGLQAEGDHRRGGAAFRRGRRSRSAIWPTACRPKSGGRRPSRSSPR